MEKKLLLNLTAVTVLSLMCGCGNSSQEQSIPQQKPVAPITNLEQPQSDISDNQPDISAVEAFADMPDDIDSADFMAQNLEDILNQDDEEEDILEKA